MSVTEIAILNWVLYGLLGAAILCMVIFQIVYWRTKSKVSRIMTWVGLLSVILILILWAVLVYMMSWI